MKMIEPIQIQLIHIARAQLGLSDDDYRLIIGAQTKAGKSSSKELTYFEADRLIEYLKTLGFKIQSNSIRTGGQARRTRRHGASDRRRGRTQGNLVVLASREQKDSLAPRGRISAVVDEIHEDRTRHYVRAGQRHD